MPKLTQVKETKRGRYALFFDGEFAFSLDADTFAMAGLHTGDELEEWQIHDLQTKSDTRKAVDKAMDLLALRDHAAGELYQKLCRSFDPHSAAAAVAKMQELNLLDDAGFARRRAAELLRKRKSRRAILDDLHAKGIDRGAAAEIKKNADILVNTLDSFGVKTHILDICRGPSVTRYELQPQAGIKVSRITSLSDDIALNLATAGVRIEAPIPGKPAVGIEVPNKIRSTVSIRGVFESQNYINMRSPLTMALGKDIAGTAQVADLCKMPHLLIAGSTGSGKSVCVNSIIISFLFRSGPEDVKLILIDPKVVELAEYNGIPHLLMPVVTEPRKAAGALGASVAEMERRYKLFAENNVRDIKSYKVRQNLNKDLTIKRLISVINRISHFK